MKFDLPIKSFKTQKEWEKWLAKNYANPKGIWLRFYKKASGVKTVVYAQALDVALMYGWIDGQTNKYDEKSYLQRFTPRRARSRWSSRNVEHITRLKKAGLMKPSGLAAIEEAKKNGQWDHAYHSSSKATLPKDFLQRLAKNKKAKDFFDTLNQSNIYAIYYRLNDAKKPETRERRMLQILDMMKKGQKFY
jgi:uncharacterized protein YdeI (YjbR/CyaY-like superfamily)